VDLQDLDSADLSSEIVEDSCASFMANVSGQFPVPISICGSVCTEEIDEIASANQSTQITADDTSRSAMEKDISPMVLQSEVQDLPTPVNLAWQMCKEAEAPVARTRFPARLPPLSGIRAKSFRRLGLTTECTLVVDFFHSPDQ
jgi:hypothetical protein